MQGLDKLNRLIVEKIRKADEVTISVNFGTPQEVNLFLKGNGPHDIAIVVQRILKEQQQQIS